MGKRLIFLWAVFTLSLGLGRQGVVGAESSSLVLSGFVDTSYSSDRNENSFALDQVEVNLSKEIKDWASLRTDLQFVRGSANNAEDVLEQGFVTLSLPREAILTLGKFNAPIGFELLDPTEMYQFSHALVFDYGLPTNLTGIMLSRSFIQMIDLDLYAVNGWDKLSDNNKEKTFGGRIGLTPREGLNWGFSLITGPEANNESARRTVLDLDGTITLIPDLTLGMEFNWGWEDKASVLRPGEEAKWFGLLLMAHYDYTKWGGFTFRYDYFDDQDGARLNGVEQQAVTFSPTFVIAEGFGALLEYRHDFSSAKAFTADNDTFALEMTYSF